MPQVSNIELKQGMQMDPTFGLQALARESARKTKQNEQMELAAMVYRRELQKKGLRKGTTVTVDQGGGVEFTGENAAQDETDFHTVRSADYGRQGKGNKTESHEISDGQPAAIARGQAFTAQNAGAIGALASRAVGLATNGVKLPVQTLPNISGTTTPTTQVPTTIEDQQAAQQASGSANLVIPSGTTNSLLGGLATNAVNAGANAASNPQNVSLKAGASQNYSASVTGDSSSEQGQNLNLETTVTDPIVEDRLKLNQEDLATAAAIQALGAQLYGGSDPGTYKAMMLQNENTMASSRAADAIAGTSTKEVAGRSWNVHMQKGGASVSEGASQDQKLNTGGNNQQQPKKVTVMDRNGDDLTGTLISDSEFSFPHGGNAMYRDFNKLITMSKAALDPAKGVYVFRPGAVETTYSSMKDNADVNGTPGNTHEVMIDKKSGKKYLSIKNSGGEEIMWQDVDAKNPAYVDNMNQIHANPGINANDGSKYTPILKITSHVGSYAPKSGSIRLNVRDADNYLGQSVQQKH